MAPPTVPVKLMRVHRFITSQQAGETFDTLHCSDSEFIVRPNEEHMLLTDMGAFMAVIEDQQQLQLDAGQPCLQLCYSIGLKGQGIKLIVNRATPLSLLLSMDCLNVVPFAVTHEQKIKLLEHAAAAVVVPKKKSI
jgi:hypothetical protein